jgi:hypothetical protein
LERRGKKRGRGKGLGRGEFMDGTTFQFILNLYNWEQQYIRVNAFFVLLQNVSLSVSIPEEPSDDKIRQDD